MTTNDSEHDDAETPEEGSSQTGQRLAAEYDAKDEEFDDELMELVSTRQRGSVLRPILMIVVIFLVGWVLYDWADELEYFFQSSEPVQLGDPARFGQLAEEDPDWEPPLEHNTYVSMEGLPTRMSTGDRYEFFRLYGAEIYVQREDEDAVDDPLADEGSSLPQRDVKGLPVDETRNRYQGSGRLISFAADPQRAAGLKEFYGNRFGVQFCEDYTDEQLEAQRREQREVVRENWRTRYEEASQQEREERELTPEPTEEQLDEFLERNPVCVDAYLLQDDKRPVDHWWYLLLAGLLVALIAYNCVKLVQWFRDWLRP